MKKVFVLLLSFFTTTSFAGDEFLRLIVPGKYILVGKSLDSDHTYHGKVHIKDTENGFSVLREINGVTTEGTASIESALNGDTKVLRIRFYKNKAYLEQTCLVRSDLDNHARISCYLYDPQVKTQKPGMEVLFHDHTAR